MNQEDMAKELDRILEFLRELDPSSKEYSEGMVNYHKLWNAFHEEAEACDADLNNRQQREINNKKLLLAEKEARDRVRMAKFEAILGLAKIGLTITGTLAAILLTASCEQGVILSNKCLTWVKAIAPRI